MSRLRSSLLANGFAGIAFGPGDSIYDIYNASTLEKHFINRIRADLCPWQEIEEVNLNDGLRGFGFTVPPVTFVGQGPSGICPLVVAGNNFLITPQRPVDKIEVFFWKDPAYSNAVALSSSISGGTITSFSASGAAGEGYIALNTTAAGRYATYALTPGFGGFVPTSVRMSRNAPGAPDIQIGRDALGGTGTDHYLPTSNNCLLSWLGHMQNMSGKTYGQAGFKRFIVPLELGINPCYSASPWVMKTPAQYKEELSQIAAMIVGAGHQLVSFGIHECNTGLPTTAGAVVGDYQRAQRVVNDQFGGWYYDTEARLHPLQNGLLNDGTHFYDLGQIVVAQDFTAFLGDMLQ